MDKKDLLPDSRLKTIVTPKGMVQGPGGMWVPVFCANCGADGGLCPAENMNFLFYLCNKCAEGPAGKLAGVMFMPDEIFWARLKEEQMASHGRLLSELELAAVVESDPSSPLAKLIKAR